MKNRLLTGLAFIILGILIAFGPQAIFPVCGAGLENRVDAQAQDHTIMQMGSSETSKPADTAAGNASMSMSMSSGNVMKCHWTAQAEIGIGSLIAFIGVLLLISPIGYIRLGISLGIALNGILALLIPTVLIGVCGSVHMNCHSLTLPALTILSAITIAASLFNALYLHLAVQKEKNADGKWNTAANEGQAST